MCACNLDRSPRTLVSDLSVLSAVAEPAEAVAGDTVTVTALVVDPDGLGVDEILAWTCTDLGDGCAEAQLVSSAGGWVQRATITDEQATVSFQIPALLASVFNDDLPELELPLRILACPPGVCPVYDEVAADPAVGSEEFSTLAAELQDSDSLVSGLAMDQACLAERSLLVSARAEAERNHNPILVGPSGDLSVDAGEDLDLSFALSDPDAGQDSADSTTLFLFPLSTDGTFDEEALAMEEAEAPLVYTAPETAGEVGLYAVGRDGLGGQAFWRGEVGVR